MGNLPFPFVTFAVFSLCAAAWWIWRVQTAERARWQSAAALSLSLASLLGAIVVLHFSPSHILVESLPAFPVLPWFRIDSLNAVSLLLFTALAIGVVILAPRRKVTPHWLSGLLIVVAATIAAYAANNLLVFLAGWAFSVLPFLSNRFLAITGELEMPVLGRIVLLATVVALAAGLGLLIWHSAPGGWTAAIGISDARTGDDPVLLWAFAFLMLAVVLRKGLLPFHSWVVSAFEQGPLLALILLVNGHLGAFLVARLAIPLLPDVAGTVLPLLGDVGLITAAYAALLAVAERRPRRLLALLSISQASFILAGLESGNPEGIAGALVLWQVVTVSTTVLAAVYTSVEARLGAAIDGTRYLGLARSAPRLATVFLIAGLALVGLPFTLGFCAEDLLMRGTLESHPQLGLILPVVTALNAVHVLRLFATIFWSHPAPESRGFTDALPRERWVLTTAILFLVLAGLRPDPVIRFSLAAAGRLDSHGGAAGRPRVECLEAGAALTSRASQSPPGCAPGSPAHSRIRAMP